MPTLSADRQGFPDRQGFADRQGMSGVTNVRRIIVLLGGLYREELLRRTLVPVLTEGGHRVLTPGRRIGAAADVDGPAVTIAGLATEVAAEIGRQQVAPCVVIGDALGALVALELALTRPSLVGAVVLSAVRTARSALCQGVHTEITSRLTTGEPIPAPALALLRALQLFSPRALADDRFMTRALEQLSRLPPEGPAQAGLVAAALDYEVSRDRLAGIATPCLVLAYEHDAITPAHQARELAGWIPGAQLRTLDLGHGGPIEDPRPVEQAISSFLAEHVADHRVADHRVADHRVADHRVADHRVADH